VDLYVINLTGSPVSIDDLGGIEVPGSSNYQLMPDPFEMSRIQGSDDLVDLINADTLILSYNGVDQLSKQDSIDVLTGISQQDLDEETEVIEKDVEVAQNNIAINALEIHALKQTEVDPDLSFFVDSFNSDDLMDSESSNYHVNEDEGYVSLVEGGSLEAKDTTKSNFDDGSHVNTESFDDVGGDGAIRKEKTIEGVVTVIEDFENISNVLTDTPSKITLAQSSAPGKVYEGSNSLVVAIDFSASSLTETGTVIIDLGVGGVDMSAYSELSLYFLKLSDGAINGVVILEDTSSNTYEYAGEACEQAGVYQKCTKDLTAAFPSIDESAVRYVTIQFEEQSTGQVILERIGDLDNDHDEVNQSKDIRQDFQVASSVECQRIKLRVRWENSQPSAPLNVAVANVFGTTLGVASLDPASASGTWAEYVLTLDNAFNLVPGNVYSVLIQSGTELTLGWDVHINMDEWTWKYYWGGNEIGDSLHFTLLTPAIQETIYLDQLEIEAESTYEQTGTFISRAINLGQTPESLDLLYWTVENGGDTVRVRVRFAATEGGLASASWSGYYTDPTGAGNNLSGITEQQWFQYEVSWTGGTTNSSSIVTEVSLGYSVPAGSGSAIIISAEEVAEDVPTDFIVMWQAELGAGTLNVYVSRDGKSTWQSVPPSIEGERTAFTSGSGTQCHLKAVLTGNARLYGWSLMCNEVFL